MLKISFIYISVLLIALAIICGCNTQKPRGKPIPFKVSYPTPLTQTGDLLSYPRSWPFVDLKPPQESKAYPRDITDISFYGGDPFVGQRDDQDITMAGLGKTKVDMWSIGFFNELGWDANLDHFNSILVDKHGFTISRPFVDYGEQRGLILKTQQYELITSEFHYWVDVGYKKNKTGGYYDGDARYYMSLPFEGYHLSLMRRTL